MSTVTETLVHSWCDLDSVNLDDAHWLKTLNWRRSASKHLSKAAQAGDVAAFGKGLRSEWKSNNQFTKKQVAKIVAKLQRLWETTELREAGSELPTLDACLFEDVSELPAVLFQNIEEAPSESTLIAALWILNLYPGSLDAETVTTLWRWTLQESQRHLQLTGELNPEDGFDHIRSLEFQLLAAVTFEDLKGGHKLLKSLSKKLQQTLAHTTDGDGTPHAQWVPQIESILCCLGRLGLLGTVRTFDPWNSKSQKLLKHFLDRVVSLYTGPNQRVFAAAQQALNPPQLELIAELFGYDDVSGLRKLFQNWQAKTKKSKPINTWLLPEECHQSDWAEWSCLRSTWSKPVDQCAVKHDGNIPEIDVIARDMPLFTGDWDLQLSVDGKPISWTDEWLCVCWFSDEEASFLELHQEQQGVKVLRQVTLLREESMLLVADAISTESAQRLDYQAQLPLAAGWDFESDSSTRESALQHDDLRVRVFPISNPQTLVESSDGSLKINGEQITIERTADSSGMFVATMFDWSKKRAKKPVDWSRLTVAEDTNMIASNTANAFRLRIGKAQWMLYHSLLEPDFPRSALGHHTNEETVFARVESDGEIVPIVEVSPED